MVTYTYETIPQGEGEKAFRFEVRQRITEDALKVHPDTGQPVRRVISPAINIMTGSKGSSSHSLPDDCPHQHSGGCCGTGMCGMG